MYDSNRKIILPNEESEDVTLRLYYKSSETTYCNYTDVVIDAGRLYVIDLDYNVSESIQFRNLNTSEIVVYNVYTLYSIDDYEPVEAIIPLAQAVSFYVEVGMVSGGFAVLGVVIAFKLRSS